MTTKDDDQTFLTVRLDKADLNRIHRHAKKDERPVSAWCRYIIRRELDRLDGKRTN